MAKYKIVLTNTFKKELRKIKKRNKKLEHLSTVVNIISNGEELPLACRDHQLINNNRFYNCRECHIEPDWLLVYQLDKGNLILLLVETGSHSDLF